MNNSLRIYRENDFSKGMNDTLPAEHLPPGYVADALNCFIRSQEIVKRTGYTRIADDLGSNACQNMKGVRFADGTKRIYAVFNGVVKSWTGSGNWVSLGGTLATTGYVDIVVANNAVYFFDGANTVVKVTSGNVLSTVAAIPKGSGAKWYHNMMFVFGVTSAPNDLRISNIGDPEDFTTGTATTIAVNANDGDYITALGELNDELIVMKTQRIFSVSGFSTSTLTVTNLNIKLSGVGTIAPQSLVTTGNEMYYMGFLGDVPHIRFLQRTRFGTIVDGGVASAAIETTMRGLNKAALNLCAGVYDGRNLWYAVADGSTAYNNKVIMMDAMTKGWVRHSGINASCWTVFAIGTTSELYFGEASADSKAYVMSTATSDNGSAINFQVISRRYGGEMAESKKKWKYLYVTAKETGNYNMTVDYAKDGFTYDNLGTINLAGSGTQFDSVILDTSRLGSTDIKRKRFPIPKTVTFYTQYKMYDTSATSSITIRDWEILYFPKHIREV
jgi:hypothetical protein